MEASAARFAALPGEGGACGRGGVCTSHSCVAPHVLHHGLCAGSPVCCELPASGVSPSTPPGPARPAVTPAPTPAASNPLDKIHQLATTGACAAHTFTSQSHGKPSISGKAPKAFLSGVASAYAKAVCDGPSSAFVQFVGNAATHGEDDIFSHYKNVFAKAGLSLATSGLANVRHIFALQLGLGMCESNGEWCAGRDMSSGFSSSSSAEAGMFQTSYGAHTHAALLDTLFAKYRASKAGCLFSTFSQNIRCSANNMKNWGATTEAGYQWQALTKSCPAFAVEYAAVLMRVHGGPKGEWNPLRKQYAEVRPECDQMLAQVEAVVTANPSVCAQLKA